MTEHSPWSEAEMVKVLRSHLQPLWPGHSWCSEQGFGDGRADLLAFEIDDEAHARRAAAGLLTPLLSGLSMATLLAIPSDSDADFEAIHAQVGYTRNTVRYRHLPLLMEAGYVAAQDGRYRRSPSFEQGLRSAVAIEAKISNWRRGLYQAYRHQLFAEETYLAISWQFAHRSLRARDEFNRFNVGLIIAHPDRAEIAIRPERRAPLSPVVRALASEHVFVAHCSSSD